jgi:hypothetical protein
MRLVLDLNSQIYIGNLVYGEGSILFVDFW